MHKKEDVHTFGTQLSLDERNTEHVNESMMQDGYWRGGQRPFYSIFNIHSIPEDDVVRMKFIPPIKPKALPVQNPVFAIYLQNYIKCVHTYLEEFESIITLEDQLRRTDLDMVCGLELKHLRDLVNTPNWDTYTAWSPVMPFDIPKISKWETEALRGNYYQ